MRTAGQEYDHGRSLSAPQDHPGATPPPGHSGVAPPPGHSGVAPPPGQPGGASSGPPGVAPQDHPGVVPQPGRPGRRRGTATPGGSVLSRATALLAALRPRTGVPLWRQPLVLTTAVLMLALLTVVGWLVVRDEPSSDSAWVDGQAPGEARLEQTPSAGGMPPAPSGPGVVEQRGSFKAYGHFAWDDDFDGEVVVAGVNAQNGARLVRYPGTDQPTPAGCAGVPRREWTELAPAQELTVGARFCYVTSEGRYGFFTVREVSLRDGKIRSLNCAFTTWRGTED